MGLGILLVILLVSQFTTFDGHVRFFLEDAAAYITDPGEAELVFDPADVTFMNQHSQFALGMGSAAERLYCFSVTDNQVTRFRSADFISESTRISVSGGCYGGVDGFIHTHPAGNKELSSEDRNIDGADIEYTCIQYDEVVKTLSGSVGGLKCWEITGTQFAPVTVGIR